MSSVRYFVRKTGFQEVEVMLDKAKIRAKDCAPPLKKAVNVMLRSIHDNFQRSGRPRVWRTLKASTLKWKLKHGYSTKPLIRTGQLRNSMVAAVTRNELKIGTAVRYARFHQYGTARIPARPFLLFQKEDIERINKLVIEHLTGKRVSV